MTPSSTAEANRRLVHEVFRAWSRGARVVTGLFAPELVCHIPGRSVLAGTYGSRAQFVDTVLRPYAARFRRGVPFRPSAVHLLHAQGDTVVIEWAGAGVANDGQAFQDTYVWILRLVEGQVVHGTMLCDGAAVDELWSRVSPRH